MRTTSATIMLLAFVGLTAQPSLAGGTLGNAYAAAGVAQGSAEAAAYACQFGLAPVGVVLHELDGDYTLSYAIGTDCGNLADVCQGREVNGAIVGDCVHGSFAIRDLRRTPDLTNNVDLVRFELWVRGSIPLVENPIPPLGVDRTSLDYRAHASLQGVAIDVDQVLDDAVIFEP